MQLYYDNVERKVGLLTLSKQSYYLKTRRFLLVTVPVFEASGNKLSRSSACVCAEARD